MELYRLQGVNLIAAYVLSVDSAIFRLMQLYERDGILTFRHNLEMPEQVHGIGYNPNLETEWVNQVIDFNVSQLFCIIKRINLNLLIFNYCNF